MGRLRFLTAGESHGPALVTIVEGLPRGVSLPRAAIDGDLARRQQGYGRGGRQKIERDVVRFRGGVRFGRTTGGPVALEVENRDFASWTDEMAPEGAAQAKRPVRVPRPGHADYAGGVKYGCEEDLRDVLERASARETTARVAAGACARALLLEAAGVEIWSRVLEIGGARDEEPVPEGVPTADLAARVEASPVRALSESGTRALVAAVDGAFAAKETLGGVFEVRARGCPVGLGSHVQWDRKLDGRIAQALLSIQAVKGVEIGDAWAVAAGPGTAAHDPFVPGAKEADGRTRRASNRAGGIEGGVTNGEEVVVRAAMKPLSTLPRPLASFDWRSGEAAPAHVERHDVCAVPAAGVIGEAMLALVLADALLECVGGDTLEEVKERVLARRRRTR
jgi:chorismate synthase